MKRVLILMSTYNGTKFLPEQLASLYRQKGVELNILVRDDGSKDSTVDLLKSYQEQKGCMTILAESNIGAVKSFHRLMAYASANMQGYDYYAFSDQDDVWLDDKIVTAVDTLDGKLSKFKLYFGAATIVDSSLNPLPRKSGKVINNLKGNIVAGHSLGCTQVMTYELMKEAAKLCTIKDYDNRPYLPLHDCWLALTAYALGAKVIYDKIPKILYRQHGGNLVGSGKGYLSVLKNRISRYSTGIPIKSTRCNLVLETLGNQLDPAAKEIIQQCACYSNRFTYKMKVLFDKEMYQYDYSTNIGVFVAILLNKF